MEDLIVTSTDIDTNNQINSECPLQDKETALKRKHESDDSIDSKVPKTESNSDDDENDDGAFCTIVSIFAIKDTKLGETRTYLNKTSPMLTLIMYFNV